MAGFTDQSEPKFPGFPALVTRLSDWLAKFTFSTLDVAL